MLQALIARSKPAEWSLPDCPMAPRRDSNPRHIQLLAQAQAYHAGILGAAGLGYEAISRATGLTTGQISYRLKKWNIKTSDYRQGRSRIAQWVIENTARKIGRMLQESLPPGQQHLIRQNGHVRGHGEGREGAALATPRHPLK